MIEAHSWFASLFNRCHERPDSASAGRSTIPALKFSERPPACRCSQQWLLRPIYLHRICRALGGLQIDDKFVLGRLHHRQVRRPLAFQNAACVNARLANRILKAGPAAHQPTDIGEPVIK
jgi:hypothetical protein